MTINEALPPVRAEGQQGKGAVVCRMPADTGGAVACFQA